jgi:hypothetical protein
MSAQPITLVSLGLPSNREKGQASSGRGAMNGRKAVLKEQIGGLKSGLLSQKAELPGLKESQALFAETMGKAKLVGSYSDTQNPEISLVKYDLFADKINHAANELDFSEAALTHKRGPHYEEGLQCLINASSTCEVLDLIGDTTHSLVETAFENVTRIVCNGNQSCEHEMGVTKSMVEMEIADDLYRSYDFMRDVARTHYEQHGRPSEEVEKTLHDVVRMGSEGNPKAVEQFVTSVRETMNRITKETVDGIMNERAAEDLPECIVRDPVEVEM